MVQKKGLVIELNGWVLGDGMTPTEKFRKFEKDSKYNDNEHFTAAWAAYKKRHMQDKPPPPPLVPNYGNGGFAEARYLTGVSYGAYFGL